MTVKTFKQRLLKVIFTLVSNGESSPTTFAGGLNTLELTNIRMQTKVVKAGGAAMGSMQAAIFGMTLSQMNSLSTLGLKIQLVPRNKVTLLAGEGPPPGKNYKVVFQGTITDAYADMNSAPEVAFRVQAAIGAAESVQANPAVSYKGSVDVATVMSGLADQMGLTFENNGVNVQLNNTYFSGSARTQAAECADQAGISWTIDDGVLAIWPRNGARKGNSVEVNPQTGMIGYPAYTSQGIMVKSLFNPEIKFANKVKITSDLKPACGVWAVYTLEHDLDARTPNGKWQSTFGCYNPDFPPPVTV